MGVKGWMVGEGVGWGVKSIEDSFPLVWAIVMMVELLLPKSGQTPSQTLDMIDHGVKVP